MRRGRGDWGMGIGDWGLGIGETISSGEVLTWRKRLEDKPLPLGSFRPPDLQTSRHRALKTPGIWGLAAEGAEGGACGACEGVNVRTCESG